MSDEAAGIGHNFPPVPIQIERAYSTTQLAADHEALAREVADLASSAAIITVVDTDADKTAAASMVIRLRDGADKVEREKGSVKRAIIDAGRNIDTFFDGLNRTSGRVGPLTAHKRRIEGLIADHGYRLAAAERERARKAAEAERERARLAEVEAARLEAEGRQNVADVVIETGMKSEAIAENLEMRAAGPVQDLARQRTPVATTGLRAQPGFEVQDIDALRAACGPLGRAFTPDALMAAIRKFRADAEAFEKWQFRDDDQDSRKRVVVARPALPGVEFFIEYLGSVRA